MTIENFRNIAQDSRLMAFKNQEIDYKGLAKRYFWDRWYWYVVGFLLFAGLSYFYVGLLEPTYEIKSKILITENEKDYSSPEDWIKRALDGTSVSDNVFNEIQLLSSFALLHQVVNLLNLDIHYYWQDGLASREGYREFPIQVGGYKLASDAFYGLSFQVVPIDGQSFKLIGEEEKEIGIYPFGENFTNQFGTFCFESNGPLPFGSERTMHVEFIDPGVVTENYLKNLKVQFSDIKSTTLELVLEDPIPQRGEDILDNAIIKYNELKNFENNRIARNTLQFIDERLVSIGQELRAVERRVESFKLNNNIASETTTDLQIVMEDMSTLDKERNTIEVQLNTLESLRQSINPSGEDFNLIAVNQNSTNMQIQEIVQPYNDLVLERRQLLLTSQPSNPLVKSTNLKLISLRTSILSAITSLQSDLRFQLNRLNGQYDKSAARLRSVPTNERNLLDKTREQGIIEGLYTYLLEKREETALSLIGISSNSIVIDPPRSSSKVVAPKKLRYYFAGSLGGLVIPFLLISVMEMFSDTIQSEDDVKEILPQQSVVGLINQDKSIKKKIVMGKNRTLISDRFRSLRTNLQFLADEDSRCILVTSSVSNEGKTFIATNLAVNFAIAEEKTIIVDFDLRNPNVARYMGEEYNKEIGLSNLFTGETDNVADIIQDTKVSNLQFITRGPIPDYPNELAVPEDRLNLLFAYLKEHYDTIIVDTSPIGIITDAILLNKHIDYSLYTVRVGITNKEMLEKARENFDQNLLVNPVLVLNGLKKGEVYGYKIK